MTTTIMRNSIVGDDWIRQTQAAIPIQKIMKEEVVNGVKTGNMVWTGDMLSGPVRLSWVHLFEPAPPMKNQPIDPNRPGKYSTVVLFPPPPVGWTVQQQMALPYEEYYRVASKDFAEYWNPAMQQYVGIHSPFHDQGEKFKYDGYTAGSVYITMNSKFKPPVVTPIPGDPNNFNPVIDPKKVYAGVWAIIAFNCYAGGKGQPVKGPMFGVQSVILIGDDTNLGIGGAADPKAAFSGIASAIPASIVRPNLAAIPGVGGLPGMPGTPPPMSLPGFPSAAPAMPMQPTYQPAPPPPTPDAEDWSFMK